MSPRRIPAALLLVIGALSFFPVPRQAMAYPARTIRRRPAVRVDSTAVSARRLGHPVLPLRIDMGLSGRPTHKAVNCGADSHNPGYSWAYGMVRDGNRYSEPDTWFCDFVEGQDATFLVAVEPPESTFTVRLTLGDPAQARGPVTVMLNGRVIQDSVRTEAGQRVDLAGQTGTRNGIIEVRLRTDDCSGFALNGLEISGPAGAWIGDLFPAGYRNRPLPKPEELPRLGPAELRGMLRSMSEFLIRSAPIQGGFSYHGTWYQNAYPIRTLLAASRILGEPRYAEPALTCLDWFVSRQLPDGNWLSNYFGRAACDTMAMPDSSANLADIGTMTLTLAIASRQCDEIRRARYIQAARTYADSISLPNQFESGAFPNGRWAARKFSFPYTVATATQTASLAALYEATRDRRYLAAAEKGAQWLMSTAQEDGSILLHPYNSDGQETTESTDFGDMFYVADALIWIREASADQRIRNESSNALNRWLLASQGVLSRTLNGYWFQPQSPWGNSKMVGILYILACQGRITHDKVLMKWLDRGLAWMSDPERSRRFGVLEPPATPIGAYSLAATGFAGLGVAASIDSSAVFPVNR